jgi:hypothetical protein
MAMVRTTTKYGEIDLQALSLRQWNIHYSLIVAPLALLSAWPLWPKRNRNRRDLNLQGHAQTRAGTDIP